VRVYDAERQRESSSNRVSLDASTKSYFEHYDQQSDTIANVLNSYFPRFDVAIHYKQKRKLSLVEIYGFHSAARLKIIVSETISFNLTGDCRRFGDTCYLHL
jgi:hypothetical protein